VTTGHITDVDAIQDSWKGPGGIRKVARAVLTVEVAAQDLQHIDISQPITITQKGEQ